MSVDVYEKQLHDRTNERLECIMQQLQLQLHLQSLCHLVIESVSQCFFSQES